MGLIDAKLDAVEARYLEIEKLLCDPAVQQDSNRFRDLSRERSSLEEVVSLYGEYRQIRGEFDEATRMQKSETDPEFRGFLDAEVTRLQDKIQSVETQLTFLLLPKDPNEGKNVLLEIRAGTGGEEAALFAGQLFRMYSRYAERKGWKCELMSMNATGLGGVKEAILSIQGKESWNLLKFESGVHRVQRVPETESGGRIHTSTATVAVLTEAEEFEVEVRESDLRVDTYRASGAGGQHVNKTESAIRITHLPTGYVVACQDERSQHQNREKAMRILRAHLYEIIQQQQFEEQGKLRRSQVGTGERSEKIRTYNFPQSRITDHRIGFSAHNIQGFMDGDIDEMTQHLKQWENEQLLKVAN